MSFPNAASTFYVIKFTMTRYSLCLHRISQIMHTTFDRIAQVQIGIWCVCVWVSELGPI